MMFISLFRHIRNILVPYNRHDFKQNLICNSNIRPIYVYYHIFCGKGEWKTIVEEQIYIIKKSNLYKIVNKFFITIIGSNYDKEYVLNKFNKSNVEIVYFSQDGSCYEFPCLQKMKEMSKHKEFYALYIHTKGSSYSIDRFKGDTEKFNSYVENVSAWRNLMNYYNIEKWDMALSSLIAGYSTYGCLLMEGHLDVKSHYSGNFWWTTSENCQNSKELAKNELTDRWNAEQWIINEHTKPYCAFYSHVLFYAFKIKSSTWLKPWWNRDNILYAFAHWTEGRKHLLY